MKGQKGVAIEVIRIETPFENKHIKKYILNIFRVQLAN